VIVESTTEKMRRPDEPGRRGRATAYWRPGWLKALTVAALGLACGLSACGGGHSTSSGVAAIGPTTTAQRGSSRTAGPPGGIPLTTAQPQASSRKSGPSGSAGPGDIASQELEFAQCMRSNGVPNFSDPSAGGGFQLPAGTDRSSPAFEAAQAKCQRFLPAGPGSGPPPSASSLAKMLMVAQCMRRHGIPDFPEPRTSVPPHALTGFNGVISDIDGVILVFPSTVDEQSPAFAQAAAACGFPLHNH
jgi:hypothetical protein